jgi:hypothetical protein
MEAETSVEFIQVLDEITYCLRAHQCHDISRVHSRMDEFVLSEGCIKTRTLVEFIQVLDRITYKLGNIKAVTSVEFTELLNEITYILRAN